MSRSNGKKLIKCKLCDTKYPSILELSMHIQETHLNILMLGQVPSPVTYSITNELGCELNIDDSETEQEEVYDYRYTCEICYEQFHRRFKLMQHQQAYHYAEDIPHKCTTCSFKSVSKSVLSYHNRSQCMNTLKKYHCKRCTMLFMWKENLKRHEKLIHRGLHKCNSCKADFATNYDLKHHTDCKEIEDIKQFECTVCSQKFKKKCSLDHHMKTQHPANNESLDVYLCPHCGKKLSSAGNLETHIIRHSDEKPFECEVCKNRYARQADLKTHQLTHTQSRAFNCSVCDMAFARLYQINTHMRTHTGERPYKCTYCTKGFAQCNDLKVHIRRHTGERPYQCKICKQRFIENKGLKRHQKKKGH